MPLVDRRQCRFHSGCHEPNPAGTSCPGRPGRTISPPTKPGKPDIELMTAVPTSDSGSHGLRTNQPTVGAADTHSLVRRIVNPTYPGGEG